MRRLISLVLICFLLSGCAAGAAIPEQKMYTATFLTVFDTVTTIKGPSESEAEFKETVQTIHDELLRYHQLFDIYNDYEGLNNLKAVNDAAGQNPVAVDRAIIDLLLDCKAYNEATNGRVNAAMGAVLRLWHNARTDSINTPQNAYLPDASALEEAAKHCDFDQVMIDEEASTVFLLDPAMSLDVGAVAKGWSVERVARNTPSGWMLSVGGNTCATGPKDAAGTPWVVGIQDPSGGDAYLHTVYVMQGSLVTSGDYQRTYSVNGKPYHHIIDPDTLYPSEYWSSVTIACTDSGLADALSTALFLLPQADGQALLEQFGAEALWVDREGNMYYSPGFEQLIRT